jgi:hypothetical protein
VAENHDKPAATPLNPRAALATGRQTRERRVGGPQPAPAAAVRFQPIDLMTDADFYMDTETGLLMVLSADIPEEKRQAELERRSNILVRRLAAKIYRTVGRPPKDDTPWAKKVQELVDAEGCGHAAAVRRIAGEMARRMNIKDETARKRLNKALKNTPQAASARNARN